MIKPRVDYEEGQFADSLSNTFSTLLDCITTPHFIAAISHKNVEKGGGGQRQREIENGQ